MTDQAQKLRELMYSKNKKGASFITVTGSSGVGKSSFALNLAVILKRAGYRPLVVQVDKYRDKEGGTQDVSTDNLTYALRSKRNPQDLITTGSSGVMLLQGGDLYGISGYNVRLIRNGFMRLEGVADIILFDAQGSSQEVVALAGASDRTFLLITPYREGLLGGYEIVKKMSIFKQDLKPFLVLNRAQIPENVDLIMDNFINTVWKYTRMSIFKMGHIIDDEVVRHADEVKRSYLLSFPDSEATADMEAIGEKYKKFLEREHGYRGSGEFLDEFFGKRQ